ncbi:MAG: D-alanyl-D-alanine carboxypeptidase family protein [Xenococcaceae cyanobacterium MO_167.B27]|nr:D-alanyl-D-alanine carboxypeptidase family protein [Xenococcaceae cyanobacterium MO_167.B27]
MIDDIPEAIRETTEIPQKSSLPVLIPATLALGGVAIAVGFFLFFFFSYSPPKSSPQASTNTVETKAEASSGIQENSEPEISDSPTAEIIPLVESVENVLGHLPYEQAPTSELTPITADGSIQLRKSAATEFLKMQAAARAEGIILSAISGFRNEETQKYLFFEVKKKRLQNTTTRAEVSAPPGYSEHHTGYAVDIGDGKVPATNLSPKFGNTPAFRWLEKNAARYSFELSFPQDNPQGISYEPWHWRYVGDRHSLETFYKARNLK